MNMFPLTHCTDQYDLISILENSLCLVLNLSLSLIPPLPPRKRAQTDRPTEDRNMHTFGFVSWKRKNAALQ